jgi:DNA-binding transcriptional MerR regulator
MVLMDATDPIARREYYSMGEVCDLTGLKPHVLRYWETQFDMLHPIKNRAGNRVFRAADIEQVLLVKHLLYDEKYTIEGARQKLQEMRAGGELAGRREVVVEPELLATMRGELEALRQILTLPPTAP